MRVKKLLSYQAKAYIEKFDKSNVIYEYDCVDTCADFYIGETKRTLLTRVKEHYKGTSNICAHINTCEHYKNSAKNLSERTKNNSLIQETLDLNFLKKDLKS